MNFKIIKPKISQDEFLETLAKQFPEVKNDIQDEDDNGLIHLQIATFARYTNECINNKRFDVVRKIFDFFEKTIEKIDPKTENAMYVSFLEHIEFNDLSQREIKSYLKPLYFESWQQLRNQKLK